MELSLRPWFTTGVVLVGATALAIAPIAPSTPSMSSPIASVRAATTAISTELHLTALDVPYLLTLPIVRQYIRNWGENWAVYLGGLAKSGVGLTESLLSIPGVTVEIVQQLFALDFVGAFDTFTGAVRDSVVAVGQPLLDSVIWRNQKYYVVQAALRAAVPKAFIDLTNGFLTAGSGVTTALIEGIQDFVGAVLTFNLGNVINAAIDGTTNLVVSLSEGAGAIVDGIEAAQKGIATALATPPPPSPFADVAAMSAPAIDVSLARTSRAVTFDTGPAVDAPPVVEETAVPDDQSAVVAVVAAPTQEPAEAIEATVEVEPPQAPPAPSKQPIPTTSLAGDPPKEMKGDDENSGKATDAPGKDTAPNTDTAPNKDTGTKNGEGAGEKASDSGSE